VKVAPTKAAKKRTSVKRAAATKAKARETLLPTPTETVSP
jgi:hypothetical protein